MLMRIVFSVMSVILSLFLNTFLLKSYGTFSTELISYQLIMRTAQPFGMLAALFISSFLVSAVTQVLGLVLYLLSLILLCVFGSGVSSMYPLFGVLLGFADAFFFSVNCMQMLSFTTDSNRDRFNGVLGLINSVISMLLPVASGAFLALFTDFTGYRVVFGVAAVCAAICLLFAAKLSVKRERRRPRVLHALKQLYGDKNCMRCIIANALSHCRSNILSVYLTLLVYNLISNEAIIGLRSTLGSAASMLSVTIYAAAVRSSNRTKSSVIAVGVVLAACLGLLFGLNVTTLMIFSVVYSFTSTFLGTPIAFTYYKSVEALGLGGDSGAEVQLAADIFVAVLVNAGFLLIAFVPRTNSWAVAVLTLMVLTSVASSLLIRAADRDLNIRKV